MLRLYPPFGLSLLKGERRLVNRDLPAAYRLSRLIVVAISKVCITRAASEETDSRELNSPYSTTSRANGDLERDSTGDGVNLADAYLIHRPAAAKGNAAIRVDFPLGYGSLDRKHVPYKIELARHRK